MTGRVKFTVASGHEYDESMVRMDYNTAKVTGNVRYGRYFIFYQGVADWIYVYYKDIVWAYHRPEDVQGRLSRKTSGIETHSLMVVTKDRKRIGIPAGSKDDVIAGLNIIQKKNTFADIGFSREKEGKYL